ncbi:MAG: 16S rRNA (cytidine(1402)-2'-O)-methyltransferase [Bacilli bacterium]|nr:16S rRNA (cytidine(1402)-2'-O)-methyltransferase [Bacilli bacterium]
MRSLNFESDKPLLYLVATPIGNLQEVSPRTLEVLSSVDLIACEDTRVTGKLLSLLGIKKDLISLREHNEVSVSHDLIEKIKKGTKVAYVSDAGYPCISDPGSKLVKICLENEINIAPVSGPNAALNALVASGLCEDHFYFHGFLNAKESVRLEELRELVYKKETLIFYEAPHRIKKTLEALYEIFGDRKACLARELTKKHEEFIRCGLKAMSEIDPETLKGEMVIVVEGSTGEVKPVISNNDIVNMVKSMVDSGMSTKDAIKKVSEMTKINKNIVYKVYHLN